MTALKPRRIVLSNKEVETLLRVTLEGHIDLLPYQLFCIFAGIRPKEVERLVWANVDVQEGWIHVPEEASKTGDFRDVRIEPVLLRWLKYLKQRRCSMKAQSPIAPKTKLRQRLRALRIAAGLGNWPQDAPRRTYASCWLAANTDQNMLNRFMGHKSPDMLYRHYHRAVTEREAKAFWQIGPPKPPTRRAKRDSGLPGSPAVLQN
ncbi:MAG: tyrosine-type recombinase/integrase [Blastocatellia bacterium]|nr:tyrosine-type recombinase/integrase [Blastocatellia bacterium]